MVMGSDCAIKNYWGKCVRCGVNFAETSRGNAPIVPCLENASINA